MLDFRPSAKTLGPRHALLPSLKVTGVGDLATVSVRAVTNVSSFAETEC